jgi:hypothetical protein
MYTVIDVWLNLSILHNEHAKKTILYHVKRSFLEMGIAIYYLIRKESGPAITKIAKCS